MNNKYLTWTQILLMFMLSGSFNGKFPDNLEASKSLSKNEILSRYLSREDISKLLITYPNKVGDANILLDWKSVRNGRKYRQSVYDSTKANRNIARLLQVSEDRGSRISIIDEGEIGGTVKRIFDGVSSTELFNFYEDNTLTRNMKKSFKASSDILKRRNQIYSYLEGYAHELNKRGVEIVLGPVMEVQHPEFKKNMMTKYQRNYGPNKEIVSDIVGMYIDVMHSHNINVVGKHFLGTSLVKKGDIHSRTASHVSDTIAVGESMDLFRVYKQDLDGIMITHTGNPFDNGKPYSLSEASMKWLTDSDFSLGGIPGLGFKGLIVGDAAEMKGVRNYVEGMQLNERQKKLLRKTYERNDKLVSRDQSVIMMFDNGVDVVISTTADEKTLDAIWHAYVSDEEFREKINESVSKVKSFNSGNYGPEFKEVSPLFKDYYTNPRPANPSILYERY